LAAVPPASATGGACPGRTSTRPTPATMPRAPGPVRASSPELSSMSASSMPVRRLLAREYVLRWGRSRPSDLPRVQEPSAMPGWTTRCCTAVTKATGHGNADQRSAARAGAFNVARIHERVGDASPAPGLMATRESTERSAASAGACNDAGTCERLGAELRAGIDGHAGVDRAVRRERRSLPRCQDLRTRRRRVPRRARQPRSSRPSASVPNPAPGSTATQQSTERSAASTGACHARAKPASCEGVLSCVHGSMALARCTLDGGGDTRCGCSCGCFPAGSNAPTESSVWQFQGNANESPRDVGDKSARDIGESQDLRTRRCRGPRRTRSLPESTGRCAASAGARCQDLRARPCRAPSQAQRLRGVDRAVRRERRSSPRSQDRRQSRCQAPRRARGPRRSRPRGPPRAKEQTGLSRPQTTQRSTDKHAGAND
jgi:hypothetical protein